MAALSVLVDPNECLSLLIPNEFRDPNEFLSSRLGINQGADLLLVRMVCLAGRCLCPAACVRWPGVRRGCAAVSPEKLHSEPHIHK